MKLRSDGAKELVDGPFGDHLVAKGIEQQVAIPYAHPQNGKAERYVCMLEDTAQTLLADSGLSLEFYGDAVLAAQYLRNRLPTSTLPPLTTPFEVMTGVKPDLSHLRAWGCQCYAIIPPEKRTKGGPRRFEAIFVGYEEGRVGWRIRDMHGKYSFSRDVIFNEDVRGRLKRPQRGQLWSDEVLAHDVRLQQLRTLQNGALSTVSGGDLTVSGGASDTSGDDLLHPQQSLIAVNDFVSFSSLAASDDHFDDMTSLESSIIHDHVSLAAHPNPLHLPKIFDLSKAPMNYREAKARPDADVWRAAMQRELDTLRDRNVFQPTTLSAGRRAVGTRWVFAYKLHPDRSIIRGKEKARLIAQGFSQRPEDFGETYAPVAKMMSIRVVLAFAAAENYEVFCYDVKSAFLHALLSHQVYLKQIEGFPEADPSTVYLALQAIYGLCQSSHEFYCLLRKVLEDIGLIRCSLVVSPLLLIHRFPCRLLVATW